MLYDFYQTAPFNILTKNSTTTKATILNNVLLAKCRSFIVCNLFIAVAFGKNNGLTFLYVMYL